MTAKIVKGLMRRENFLGQTVAVFKANDITLTHQSKKVRRYRQYLPAPICRK